MPSTTNFGWTTPADTDLVKDGAAAIRTLGNGVDASFVDLKGGTTGQILSKNSNTDLDFTWIANDQGDITAVTAGTGMTGGGTTGAVTLTNDMATTITAAGDIVVGTGSGTYDNLPIGTTGQILTADTTVSPYKVKWATASSTPSFVGWNIYRSTSFTSNNNATTYISYGDETFDTSSFHDTSTNPSRVTIPAGKAGKYLLTAQVKLNSINTTGIRQLFIYVNRTTGVVTFETSGLDTQMLQVSAIWDLAENDYVEVRFYQTSTTTVTVSDVGADRCFFSGQYLGA